jgi:hypothetical protein
VVRIGWFASMSEALLVATTDGGDQVDLLIVPPDLAQDVAERAMAKAADPANVEHAPELLARATARRARRADPDHRCGRRRRRLGQRKDAPAGGADLTDDRPPTRTSSVAP